MKFSDFMMEFLSTVIQHPRFLKMDRDDLMTARKERIWITGRSQTSYAQPMPLTTTDTDGGPMKLKRGDTFTAGDEHSGNTIQLSGTTGDTVKSGFSWRPGEDETLVRAVLGDPIVDAMLEPRTAPSNAMRAVRTFTVQADTPNA